MFTEQMARAYITICGSHGTVYIEGVKCAIESDGSVKPETIKHLESTMFDTVVDITNAEELREKAEPWGGTYGTVAFIEYWGVDCIKYVVDERICIAMKDPKGNWLTRSSRAAEFVSDRFRYYVPNYYMLAEEIVGSSTKKVADMLMQLRIECGMNIDDFLTVCAMALDEQED